MRIQLTGRVTVAFRVALIAALIAISPLAAQAGDKKDQPSPAVLDPNTGLPVPEWKDPKWKDPEKVLPEVSYDGVPLGEIAKILRRQFNDEFDVLIPNGWQDAGDSSRTIDPQTISIKMELKNVTASEIFNAMNLVFDTENTPLRWELKLNGRRPTAVLRVLPALVPPVIAQPPPEPHKRIIYFVGDLLGEEKSGGLTMEQLVKTVSEVYEMSYGTPRTPVFQFHKQAQLLILTGTADQISLVTQTISALKQKAQLDRSHATTPETGGLNIRKRRPESVPNE